MTDVRRNDPGGRYDAPVVPGDGTAAGTIVELVPARTRVLDLGCGSGRISRVLAERGCTVVGAELDPLSAAYASAFQAATVLGDLSASGIDALRRFGPYDVVVAADVLEHLPDPVATTGALRALTVPGGLLVLSLPNVAHAAVRLALAQGRWEYRDVGLLDRTHLRFFTRSGAERLVSEAGWALERVVPIEREVADAYVELDEAALPDGLAEAVWRDPDARAFQHVLVATNPAVGEAVAAGPIPPADPRAARIRSALAAIDHLRAERTRIRTSRIWKATRILRRGADADIGSDGLSARAGASPPG